MNGDTGEKIMIRRQEAGVMGRREEKKKPRWGSGEIRRWEEQENDNEIGARQMEKQQEGKSCDGEVGKCGR